MMYKQSLLGIDTKKVADAALLGAGLVIGAILVMGGIKTVNRFSGGLIPEDFTSYSMYGTGNTLSPDGEGGYWT